MIVRTAADTMKTELLARRWDGLSSSEVVFATGSVLVTEAPVELVLASVRTPAALIRIGPSVSDPEEPTLIVQTFGVVTAVAVPGDAFGQNAMMGANQQANSSRGRGLLEVEEEVKATLAYLDQDQSMQVVSYSSGDDGAVYIEEIGYVAYREYKIDAQLATT